MPSEMFVVEGCGLQDGVTLTRSTELVPAPRHGVDGDEKETAFADPWRYLVRQALADRRSHRLVNRIFHCSGVTIYQRRRPLQCILFHEGRVGRGVRTAPGLPSHACPGGLGTARPDQPGRRYQRVGRGVRTTPGRPR